MLTRRIRRRRFADQTPSTAQAIMRLSEFTDYTLRVLIYCAEHPDRLVTVSEVSEHHGLSKSHVTKIVNALAHQRLLETVRGRGGGFRLMRDPGTVRIGDVVRAAESDFRLVECFDMRSNRCKLNPACRLKKTLMQALRAFYAELDRCTLAEIAAPGPSASGRDAPATVKIASNARRASAARPAR